MPRRDALLHSPHLGETLAPLQRELRPHAATAPVVARAAEVFALLGSRRPGRFANWLEVEKPGMCR